MDRPLLPRSESDGKRSHCIASYHLILTFGSGMTETGALSVLIHLIRMGDIHMRKPLFTTVDDFEQATADLRPHFGKGIGLNALRTAIAKAHGFDHVSAYRQHLSGASSQIKGEGRGRGSTGPSSEAPNPNIFVKVLGDIVYLQGLIDPSDHNYSMTPLRSNGGSLTHEWKEHLSLMLTGTKKLCNVEQVRIGDKLYARGYFDISREDSYVSAVIGVRTFLEEQEEDSYGHIIYQILFNQIYSALRADHLAYAEKLAAMGDAYLRNVDPKAFRKGDLCTHEIGIVRDNVGQLMRLTFARFKPYMDCHDGREVLEGAFDSSRFERHLAKVVHASSASGSFVSYEDLVDRAYSSLTREAMGLMEDRLILEYWSSHRDNPKFTGDGLRLWVHENYDNLYSVLLGDFVFGRALYVDTVAELLQRRA